MLGVASRAHARATGDEEALWESLKVADHDRPAAEHRGGPAGEAFDFDDDEQMRVRLPRLAAVYGP